MRMTQKARKVLEGSKKQPKRVGMRRYVGFHLGYDDRNDGFHRNNFSRSKKNYSRNKKEGKIVKTPGRKPEWLELLEA